MIATGERWSGRPHVQDLRCLVGCSMAILGLETWPKDPAGVSDDTSLVQGAKLTRILRDSSAIAVVWKSRPMVARDAMRSLEQAVQIRRMSKMRCSRREFRLDFAACRIAGISYLLPSSSALSQPAPDMWWNKYLSIHIELSTIKGQQSI